MRNACIMILEGENIQNFVFVFVSFVANFGQIKIVI